MNPKLAEIQALIADIDNLLANKGKRLSRILSNRGQEPRQVIERIRDFLVRESEGNDFDQASGLATESQAPQLSPLLVKFVDDGQNFSQGQKNYPLQSEQKTELRFDAPHQSSPEGLQNDALAPLQTELQTLLSERANLVREIRELEQQRLQNYSLAQQVATQEQMISEFLQVLLNRLTPNLTPEQTEALVKFQTQPPQIPQASQYQGVAGIVKSSNSNLQSAVNTASDLPDTTDQIDRLARLSRELDQRLLALDSTVNVVFDALQSNVHTYHESLSQALSRMHSKGVQGEHLLTSLINNLTQQLQQQVSSMQPTRLVVDTEKVPSTADPAFFAESVAEATAKTVEKPLDKSGDNILQLSQNPTSPPQLDEGGGKNIVNNLEVETTLDLDKVLSELENTPQTLQIQSNQTQSNQNQSNQKTATPTQSPSPQPPSFPSQFSQQSSQSIADEVDQLYASLFGIEDFTDSNPEATSYELVDSTEQLKTTKTIPPIGDTLPSNLPDIGGKQNTEVPLYNNDATNLLPLQPATVQDVTFEFNEEDVFANSDFTFTQDSSFGVTNSRVLDAPQTTPEAEIPNNQTIVEVPSVNEIVNETVASEFPSNVTVTPEITPEIISDVPKVAKADVTPASTSLSITTQGQAVDLNPDIPDPWLEEALSQESTAAVKPVDASVADTITTLNDLLADEPQTTQENYINASASENLFDKKQQQARSVPSISLNPQQLQQLDQDLTAFDSNNLEFTQRSTPSSKVSQTNISQTNISQTNAPAVTPDLPKTTEESEFDLTSTASLFPDTLKQNEVTTATQAVPVVSGGNGANDTENSLDNRDSIWYLGIDLGTTGISAALLNRTKSEVYSIYWSQDNQGLTELSDQSDPKAKRTFRLPTEVYLPTQVSSENDLENNESVVSGIPAAVAEERVPNNLANSNSTPEPVTERLQNLFATRLKPYLQIALPYKNDRQKWEPVLQINDFSTVPLVWVIRTLSKLFLTLKSDVSSTTLGLTANAVGLDSQSFANIINNIAGVVCTCPLSWTEQYRFNVREALLTSGLVKHPQQVFFVEEAIASLLSELDGANGEKVKLITRQGSRPASTTEQTLQGNSLVINIGALSTEMALTNLPESLQELAHSDFMLHGFTYAAKGIEQDIICQLLLSPKWRKARSGSGSASNKTISSNPWHWQPTTPGLDQMRFSSLAIEDLELPRPGEPDLTDRIRLQQRLESSVLGQAILDAAIALKLILQHQDTFTLELADQRWELHRRDLESQVFVPFVRRLNRELNRLLVAKGIPTEAINQAILTGGVGTLGAVGRWLRQKLPNARIIQDLYLGEGGTPSCSRVAYGLAMLPLHPLVLEVPRQQYTDYFLFTELLRLLPERSLSFGEVIQLFEGRGINTRTCQQRLLAFLEGELPAGFVPNTVDSSWLSQSSKENSDYKAISQAPLFEKQGSLTYRPNPQQLQYLRRYLQSLAASTMQSLEEPYTVNFALGVYSG